MAGDGGRWREIAHLDTKDITDDRARHVELIFGRALALAPLTHITHQLGTLFGAYGHVARRVCAKSRRNCWVGGEAGASGGHKRRGAESGQRKHKVHGRVRLADASTCGVDRCGSDAPLTGMTGSACFEYTTRPSRNGGLRSWITTCVRSSCAHHHRATQTGGERRSWGFGSSVRKRHGRRRRHGEIGAEIAFARDRGGDCQRGDADLIIIIILST